MAGAGAGLDSDPDLSMDIMDASESRMRKGDLAGMDGEFLLLLKLVVVGGGDNAKRIVPDAEDSDGRSRFSPSLAALLTSRLLENDKSRSNKPFPKLPFSLRNRSSFNPEGRSSSTDIRASGI